MKRSNHSYIWVVVMAGPTWAELWPSLDPSSRNIPQFTEGNVWNALMDLKSQLDSLLNNIGSNERNDVSIDSSKGRVFISDSAKIGPSVHIIGPAYIGPDAEIRHGAYVREYSWICDSALVGHASEVKHSILLPNSKAPHFNYVGDSILGPNVNLGAGVKLSNLRNDGGEVHTIIEGSRVPTGLRKFGAIIGENSQLGCNAVTNPGVVLGANCNVMPNTTVTGVYGPNSKIG